MGPLPTVDECCRRLHRPGWSLGEFATAGGGRVCWRVSGRHGENAVEAAGASQAEAWQGVSRQAEALGMRRR
jgi:hypothetical protein